jgi:uncharacterized protein DUF5681
MAWTKGQSGNPKGRAVEKPFADALRMEIKEAGSDHQQLRAIARKLLDKAEAGDMQAINCLADRLDGKLPQAVELSDETPRYVIHAPLPCRTAEEWEAEVRAAGFGASQLPAARNGT